MVLQDVARHIPKIHMSNKSLTEQYMDQMVFSLDSIDKQVRILFPLLFTSLEFTFILEPQKGFEVGFHQRWHPDFSVGKVGEVKKFQNKTVLLLFGWFLQVFGYFPPSLWLNQHRFNQPSPARSPPWSAWWSSGRPCPSTPWWAPGACGCMARTSRPTCCRPNFCSEKKVLEQILLEKIPYRSI